jgi:CO/xanthine dehydrogenase Mo-binding subunit
MQERETLDVIGKPYPKKDARIKVTGECRYAGDMIHSGMLHGKLLRSPHAHARILSIDSRKALPVNPEKIYLAIHRKNDLL